MDPLQFLVPLDWIDTVGPYLALAILAVAFVNAFTRLIAQRNYRTQAEYHGDDGMSRFLPHVATNVVLVLLAALYVVYAPHGGLVTASLVATLFVADVFEFESRQVEARNNMSMEQPKAALTAWLLVVTYASYQALFQYVAPYWEMVV